MRSREMQAAKLALGLLFARNRVLLVQMQSQLGMLFEALATVRNRTIKIRAVFDVRHRVFLHLKHERRVNKLYQRMYYYYYYLIFSIKLFFAKSTLKLFFASVSSLMPVHVRLLAEIHVAYFAREHFAFVTIVRFL